MTPEPKHLPLWLIVLLTFLKATTAQNLQSPCPDIFNYRVDPGTSQIFGFIEINSIPVGQVVKIDVDLSIGTQLPSQNVGSITLIKPRIVRGEPAQYRVNFPLQNILPSVLNIALNGQTICTGHRASGRVVTTINHTLYTELNKAADSGGGNLSTFEQRPVYQPQPQPTPPLPDQVLRPPPVAATEAAPVEQPAANYTCGRPSSAFLNRLAINGGQADKGQFPWIVPLFDRSEPRNPKYICGSTIIRNRFLITAAHCVFDTDEGDFFNPTRLLAIPGMFNIDNFFDDHAQIVDIDKIIPNEEYVHDEDTNDADLAVLRMKITLTFTDYIIPICPWQGENDLSKIVGQEGIVAGWGLTQFGKASTNPTFVRSRVVDRLGCIRNLNRMYPKYARIFCGDGEGSVPCNGDSGSGMVIKRGNQYYLRGVVSKGLLDPTTLKCDANKFAIFTDIVPFRFWLRSVTQV